MRKASSDSDSPSEIAPVEPKAGKARSATSAWAARTGLARIRRPVGLRPLEPRRSDGRALARGRDVAGRSRRGAPRQLVTAELPTAVSSTCPRFGTGSMRLHLQQGARRRATRHQLAKKSPAPKREELTSKSPRSSPSRSRSRTTSEHEEQETEGRARLVPGGSRSTGGVLETGPEAEGAGRSAADLAVVADFDETGRARSTSLVEEQLQTLRPVVARPRRRRRAEAAQAKAETAHGSEALAETRASGRSRRARELGAAAAEDAARGGGQASPAAEPQLGRKSHARAGGGASAPHPRSHQPSVRPLDHDDGL